jgi:hypothetical protein
MITDNYLNGAIETLEEARNEMDAELARLKIQEVDVENLERLSRLLKKAHSLLVRMREAYS